MMANVGETSNTGFEVTIAGTPVIAGDFRWDASFNFARNRNMLVSMSNEKYSREQVYLGSYSITGIAETTMILEAGKPLGEAFTLFARIDEKKFLEEMEEKIDDYTKFMEENHIKRLGEGVCTAYVGAQYLSLSSNAERVADHLLNVGKSIKTYAFIEAK